MENATMIQMPTEQDLRIALSAAGTAHHDYESNFLAGSRDEQWAGWYAAFVLGHLGQFTTPTSLTRWLLEGSGDGDWPKKAAANILSNLQAV